VTCCFAAPLAGRGAPSPAVLQPGDVQWSPRAAETAALAAVGLGLALAVLLVDPVGRVLVGAAALVVLLLAGRDTLLRPRLTAGPDGVVVHSLSGRRHLPWHGLRIAVRATKRWGVRSRTLELDTAAGPDDEGVLVLLGRRDLGTDPDEVARVLRAMSPS
jgi:Bacterial PH domain